MSVTNSSRSMVALCIGVALATGCKGTQREEETALEAPPTASTKTLDAAQEVPLVASGMAPPPRPVVLIAGGDIDLSRTTGQRILTNPELDPFVGIRSWLTSADLRFANLESQLCELGGKTVSEHNRLIFAGPPTGAEVVRRGGFDILSTANNHAWDFGLRCLDETIRNLQRVGIRHVGTDAAGKDPLRPVEIERHGQRFAFFAVTGIFNHGPLGSHEAKSYVAGADMGALGRRIAKIRDRVDQVVVSVHVGEEYMHVPIEATRYVLIGAVEAGADVVLGHHTHTPQRVEFHKGKPVVMSLGNFVFHQHRDHPWTGWSYLARVTFLVDGNREVEICPYHIFDASPRTLTERQEAAFFQHWDRISTAPGARRRGERSADGCVRLMAP